MQELKIKVSNKFFKQLNSRKLSPIRVTPLTGYIYKHHFVVDTVDITQLTLAGKIGSANPLELTGTVLISFDGDSEELAEIVL
jgi:hypothetical protein